MFRGLGPDVRDLLGVIAFFPQGIDENNFDWLFPTIPNKRGIFDLIRIDRRENVKQMLDVHVLRHDPLRSIKAGFIRTNIARQPAETMLLGRAKKWG